MSLCHKRVMQASMWLVLLQAHQVPVVVISVTCLEAVPADVGRCSWYTAVWPR